MPDIRNPFTDTHERLLSEIRQQREASRRRKPLPRLGAEKGKVSRRKSSPILALYERLGVDVKDLQA